MTKSTLLLVPLVLIASITFAKDLSGTYEFRPPEGSPGVTTTVQLARDDEGNYSAQLSFIDETIKATNVIVNEDKFSFDIEIETPIGNMHQAMKVQVAEGEVTLSILSDIDGQSESISLKGALVKNIEGTYEFPPPDGAPGDSTTIQLTKDEGDKFSATVTIDDETIKATNVIVNDEEFSFDTEVKTQIGDMTQAWKVQVAGDEVSLSVLADVGGQSNSVTLMGKRVETLNDKDN